MMPIIQGTVTGTHPLGEPLIQSILDYKYDRAGNEPVKEKFHSELNDLIELQQELGFPYLSTGNLGVEDLIRPFTRSLPALQSYEQLGDLPINRFHYTNTFYRQPTVIDTLPEDSDIIQTDTNTITGENAYSTNALSGIESKFIIAGPYSFAKMVNLEEETPYSQIDDLILDAATLLANELSQLGDEVKQVQLDDPHLVWERVPRTLHPVLREAYSTLASSLDKEIIVHTYFNSASTITSFLLELDIDGIGIDFYKTNPVRLKDFDFSGKILQAGLVNSQNYVPTANGDLDTSNTGYLAEVGRSLLELNPDKLQIGTTTSLEYVPRDIADGKLRQVQAIVDQIQEVN